MIRTVDHLTERRIRQTVQIRNIGQFDRKAVGNLVAFRLFEELWFTAGVGIFRNEGRDASPTSQFLYSVPIHNMT